MSSPATISDLAALANFGDVHAVIVTVVLAVFGVRVLQFAIRKVRASISTDSGERGVWYDAYGTPRYVDGEMEIATGKARRFQSDL